MFTRVICLFEQIVCVGCIAVIEMELGQITGTVAVELVDFPVVDEHATPASHVCAYAVSNISP